MPSPPYFVDTVYICNESKSLIVLGWPPKSPCYSDSPRYFLTSSSSSPPPPAEPSERASKRAFVLITPQPIHPSTYPPIPPPLASRNPHLTPHSPPHHAAAATAAATSAGVSCIIHSLTHSLLPEHTPSQPPIRNTPIVHIIYHPSQR